MARFTLAHNRSDMVRLAHWLDEQEQALWMPGEIALAVRQCLEEAVANLIDHTSQMANEMIAVGLDWQNGMLVATVEDSGAPFDPRTAAPVAHATNLETLEPGGWGIHLIKAFANEIDYQTVAGRNRLTLRFARPPHPR